MSDAHVQLEDLRKLQKEIEVALAALGLQMDYDLGAIPGEGHSIATVAGGEVDLDQLPDDARQLAAQWSSVTDQIEVLVYEADELIEVRLPRP